MFYPYLLEFLEVDSLYARVAWLEHKMVRVLWLLAWISTEPNSPNLTPARLHILWAFSPCSVMLNVKWCADSIPARRYLASCLHVSRDFRVLVGEVGLQ